MATSVWVTWPALTKFGTLGIVAGLLTLAVEREQLFENNLIDVEDWEARNAEIVCDERSLTARTEDGTCNILSNPAEGAANIRFGRNVARDASFGETDTLLTPNPREISNKLMARDEFKPAASLNFIAASWIQFMVHDWFDHGPGADGNPIEVPLPAGDPFGTGSLQVKRTLDDPTRTGAEAGLPETYVNKNTHWWDGSQIYGSDKDTNDEIRSFVGGKLKINSDGTLPTGLFGGVPVTGFSENWWVGLSMMHQLFVREHNAIADMLNSKYPGMTDQWVYDRARLINSALMAKIHTVEWTPAIIANPVTERAMYANWWGLLGDGELRDKYQGEVEMLYEDLQKSDSFVSMLLGFNPMFSDGVGSGSIDHALAGIVGSTEPNNYGVPYTLTEEFVAVYRMHPLMRDNIDVYDIGSNVVARQIPIQDTRDGDAESMLSVERPERLWYSFGITNPGALTLKNYPNFLRNLSVPFAGNIDLATIDVLRDRERGVPRYNEFRRQIGLNPITRFEDLTTDPEVLAELKRIYNNDIEMIDALVGQLAETVRPEGFGFGETAFQIFIMNASRRLMTDRFFTKDFRPGVYTQEGLDWVNDNTMVDVLRRHFPQLQSSLVGVENAFKPWGLNIPDDYESWNGCDKQEHLWVNGAMRTEYADGERPALVPIDVLGLIDSILWKKVKDRTDVSPPGYEKPLHPYGAMAKVSFVPTANHSFTGLFKGNECGLLRLSVTGDPADRGFAPGLAWKAFVDGKPSENVSALYTLTGQGGNYNYFANELSQYVQQEVNESLGTSLIFSLVTSKPTLLRVDDMAEVNQDGSAVGTVKSPTQIYFVPTSEVRNRFSSAAHDFRDDLTELPAGTTVYDVYATNREIRTSIFPWVTRRYAEERRSSAVKVGSLKTTSPFTTSHFGDTGIFFKHQRHEDK
ncbi:MAG: peroxidase [Alcanivoracaceae bacterium]|nr:peroxidase [Alcanivoracaceae bacterium]